MLTGFENIEFNDEFKKALDPIENTDENIFVTGKAGSKITPFIRDVIFSFN